MQKPSFSRRLVTSVLIAGSVILSPYGPPHAHAATTVVIGEVAWAGSSISTADEWFELWNLGDTPAEIGGYKVQQGSDGVVALPPDAVIPPRSVYLVSNYAASDTKSALAATPHLVTTAVSLSNSALSLTFLDGSDHVIDQVGDGGKPPAGSSGSIKTTMIRSGDAWVAATNSQGFDDGRPELGTPGTCDGCPMPDSAPPTVDPVPAQTPTPVLEATTTEVAIVPEAATSTEIVTTPVIEPPVTETTTTDTAAILQPLEGASTEPMPSNDTPVLELPPPVDVTEATTGTDPELAIPPSTEPTTTMTTDPLPQEEPLFQVQTETPSTTEPTIENIPATTSTMEIPLVEEPAVSEMTTSSDQTILQESASDVPTTPETSTTTSPTPTNQNVDDPATVVASRYDLLRLNEFSAHPASENEWIELTSLDASMRIALEGVMLYDAAGKIFTFATGTVDSADRFVTATLASSHLNNGGDTVYLKDPNGTVLDSVQYEESTSGWTWARTPDGTGTWAETPTSTPDTANAVPASVTNDVTTAATSTSSETPAPTTQPAQPTTAPSGSVAQPIPASAVNTTLPIMAVATSTATTKTPQKAKETTTKTKPENATQQKEPTPQPKTVVAKTITKTTTKSPTSKPATKAVAQIKSISFDMKDYESSRGIRVSLQGQVGSPSGLLPSHAFILLSPDGRGLQVRVPTAKKLPEMNEVVIVQGTLLFTDAGMPYLKLGTNDDWKTIDDAIQMTQPRAANLFTPGAEDAWSLVSATGTVRHIGASSATLEIDGADVDVTIKKVIQYRLSRLSVGDTIQVTGLLDVSSDTPKIVPRNEQELALVSHAPAQTAKTAPTGLPGWTPFGAAGVAVAGTEGFKQLRERRKRRALEEIVETRLNTMV